MFNITYCSCIKHAFSGIIMNTSWMSPHKLFFCTTPSLKKVRLSASEALSSQLSVLKTQYWNIYLCLQLCAREPGYNFKIHLQYVLLFLKFVTVLGYCVVKCKNSHRFFYFPEIKKNPTSRRVCKNKAKWSFIALNEG